MRVIQFLEPVSDDFIGPFASEMAAKVWLRENDRHEKHIIHDLVDPASAMYSGLLCWSEDDAKEFGGWVHD